MSAKTIAIKIQPDEPLKLLENIPPDTGIARIKKSYCSACIVLPFKTCKHCSVEIPAILPYTDLLKPERPLNKGTPIIFQMKNTNIIDILA